jgi:ribosomal RNA-processing protein 1
MDKYYMLLRRWINASFRLLARAEWREEVVERYNEILTDIVNGPLAWSNPRTPVSLAWHLADIWVEELDKVLREDSSVRLPHYNLSFSC